MAYASLLSLGQTLEQIMHPDNESLLRLHQTEQQFMRSMHEKVGFLLAFLDVISPKNSDKTFYFEKRIRDAAYGAEDLIESQIHSKQVLSKSHVSSQIISRWEQKYKGFHKVKEELDAISEELVQKKESNKIEIQQPSNCLPDASTKSGFTNKSIVLGFDDDLNQVQNLLVGGPPELFIVSLCGMPGIGKTTLARKIYNDSDIAAHFHIRAWVTVSRGFRDQQVLEDILNSIGDLNRESRKLSTDKLAEKLYKRLKHKRFLIVIDDVWDSSAVEKIRSFLPEDNSGSRILLTTRSITVAERANPYIKPHLMKFLMDEESWNLLCRIAFREERCPPELERFKERIIKKCNGHPIAIVLTGGLLYKAERTVDYWKYIVTNMLIYADNSMLNIMNFCYGQLPHHLRACLLYMGVLPEDYEISRSNLIMLWVANRFIRPHKLKSLEEVAEENLQDLVDRNLIVVCEWTHSGKIKTCTTHDLIRDFCLMKAKGEMINKEVKYILEVHDNLRHVSILIDTIPKFELAPNHDLRIRSVTFFSYNSPSDIHFVTSYWFLRILDALTLSFDEFPIELLQFVTLRYIAVSFWLKYKIPASISELCNLETLIINPGKLRSIFNTLLFPPEIWKLSKLRHLLFKRGFLPYPTEALNIGNNYVLFENLQTLTNVVNFKWTKEVLRMMPNLKKLVISYEHDGRTEWSSYCFDNFVLLHQLEVLKCFFFGKSYMKYHDPLPVKFSFPQKLTRLTLEGCRISWKDMTNIGALPHLQVLKLRFHAFEGLVWEPNNGEFRQLIFLLIHMTDLERWKADETHFPSLECLTLNYCYNLVEIPFRIGKIPNLREINLCGCSTSLVTSAEVIQEEQRKLGNNEFRVYAEER